MEESTLVFLLEQLSLSLENYHDLTLLKKDLYEYASFMAEVYAMPIYFSDYCLIKHRYSLYLKSHHYQDQQFTQFQRYLILRCLFEGLGEADLDLFITINQSDEEVEKTYQQYFGK